MTATSVPAVSQPAFSRHLVRTAVAALAAVAALQSGQSGAYDATLRELRRRH